jgi:hypothetical protein
MMEVFYKVVMNDRLAWPEAELSNDSFLYLIIRQVTCFDLHPQVPFSACPSPHISVILTLTNTTLHRRRKYSQL